jgi:hypothetical protein
MPEAATLPANVREAIASIPGSDGWWHSSSREDFEAAAARLLGAGVTEDLVVEILSGAFAAAARERS